MQVDIIIPNYNGLHLLARYVPVVINCCIANLVIVDDASTDDSVDRLNKQFPQVEVITRDHNAGFSAAVNDGIKRTSGDIVVLLNNDIEVTPGFLDPILPLFEDETVFAASPQIILPSKGGLDEGANTGFWRHGMFYTGQRQGIQTVTPVLYTTGCAAVYRRSMLEQLGGFDEAYSPFYWEDADLGYRAWKRGWKSLYQPDSTVYHQHSASISRLKKGLVDSVKARNGLFFIWRNIEDQSLLKAHRQWLPFIAARRTMAGDISFARGLKAAWARRNEAEEARYCDSNHRVLSDSEIFTTVGTAV